MKLYDYFRSSAAYRVRIALNLKGLAPERAFVHLRRGAQRADDYLALNPQGLVPSLVTDDGRRAHAIAGDHRVARRGVPGAAAAAVEPRTRASGCVRSRSRSPATSTRSTTLRVLAYLTGTFGATDAQKDGWYRYWCDVGFEALETRLAREPATGAFCHGAAPTLADICLVPQLANARRVEPRPRTVPDAAAHRGRVPGAAARSRTRRRRSNRMPSKRGGRASASQGAKRASPSERERPTTPTIACLPACGGRE